ncbi:MAG: S-layer homology domain-containing protein [Clostridia bacterium]|nr:S-layer homology domain-containing protein [Clostridia bacterium]
MKCKAKKIITLLLTVTMLLSTVNVFALEYGAEWGGYVDVDTQKYSDVPRSHWAHDAIVRASEKNWFSGYPDGSFRPNASITRAEALKVFVVFLGLDYQSVDLSDLSYSDISTSDWYAPYVEAGKDLFPSHTTIQGKTPFNPNMPVTREDTIYALVKALGCDVDVKYTDQSVLNMFSDANSISGNIKSIFSIALMHELVSGFPDGTIRAQAALTRAEFATLLLRGTEHGFHDKYEAKISKVTVFPASPVEIEIGESVTLSANATYTDGTVKPYTSLQPYDAENNSVISLEGTTITGLKEGTTTIKYNDSYLKKDSLTVIVKKPTDAPKIKVTDYPDTTDESRVTISGAVIDKNVATVDFTCNSKDILLNADGSFSTIVSLKPGVNTIKFTAVNEYNMSAEKTIEITRTSAPSIFITKYKERTTASKTTVEGIITDGDLSTVKLSCNGADISMNADGSFATEVNLKMGKNPFTFAATNQYGKTAQQAIEITRYEIEDSGKIEDKPDVEKTEGKVELVFVIDATGSMWDEIGNVKTNISEFAKYLEEEGVDLKMSVVEYRDITCGEPTKVHKYSGSTWHTDSESLISTLASIGASGGGDNPESVLDGFGHVLDNRHMDWSDDAFKFAVLLTDADYKTENTYSYSSLEEIANELAAVRMTTSVITSTSLFDTYNVLNSKTGGLQIDITSDFDKALSDLADKITGRSLRD